MAKPKFYVKCAKCGKEDKTTARVMVCYSCGTYLNNNKYGHPQATLCRNCCPTGHGTKVPESWLTPKPKVVDIFIVKQMADMGGFDSLAKAFTSKAKAEELAASSSWYYSQPIPLKLEIEEGDLT